jgi:hypothetical protein
MTVDDLKWIIENAGPYASLFLLLAWLIVRQQKLIERLADLEHRLRDAENGNRGSD